MYLVYKSKGKTDSTTSLEYLYIVQALMAGGSLNFTTVILSQPIGLKFILSIIGICVLGYTIQTCITRATMQKKTSHIMPIGYIGITFSFIIDVVVYKVNFDWISLSGMILTSLGLLSKLFIK